MSDSQPIETAPNGEATWTLDPPTEAGVYVVASPHPSDDGWYWLYSVRRVVPGKRWRDGRAVWWWSKPLPPPPQETDHANR